MAKLGFIGMGNMGFAMLKACVDVFDKSEIIATDKNTQLAQARVAETGIVGASSNEEVVKNAKYIVLAVKPQFYNEVYKSIEDYITKDHVVISLAPGITTGQVKDALGFDLKVVRIMPNTPAAVKAGMTGITYDESQFTQTEIFFLNEFFGSFGKYKKVPEAMMDVVTCASGSSPAYVYIFIEALADSIVALGMPRDDAYVFAAQTVLGSAKMVLESGEHPAVLKDRVCSPAGTTIEGVKMLEECGFRNAVIKATEACYEKSVSFKK